MNLVKYLRDILEVENNKFILEQMKANEEAHINSLNNLFKAKEPLIDTQIFESQQNIKNYHPIVTFFGTFLLFPFIFKLSGFIFEIVIFFIIVAISDSITVTIGLFIAFATIFCIILTCSEIESHNKHIATLERLKEEQKKIILTNKKINEFNKKIDIHQNISLINVSTLNEEIKKINSILKKIYAPDILYIKYKNIYCVTKILEYYESGRCDSLSGSVGAYNLLENEGRLDEIINKLHGVMDSMTLINNNLNIIKNQNQRVALAISETNDRLDKIGYNMQYINNNQTIALEKNIKATEEFKKIYENNSTLMLNLAEYQNFATKQQRLAEGRWS